MKKLMVVGGIPDAKHNILYGGATVLTKLFLDFLKQEGVNHVFVRTNRFANLKTKKKDPLRSALVFFPEFFARLPFVDIVMFNFSDNGVVSLFPILSAAARALGKKVILRKFGGSFDIFLETVSDSKRTSVIQALEKSDLILFETKAGIEYLKTIADAGNKVVWFPNVRPAATKRKNPEDFNNRLVFLSHIKDEKGVGDLLKLAQKVRGKFTIDLYGAIKEDKYLNFDWAKYGVNYNGIVAAEKVTDILKDSLLLLLPSYREGYPGIIIEALSVGLPVLTTNVGGIPEMICDGKEGFIVEPGDIDSAYQRLNELTADQYNKMCAAAINTFNENFEAETTNRRILSYINSIRQ